jgi:A/G-specific adenine glycosylase
MAYATLVSEFMLQQTTVTTVVPKFERFLSRFPNLCALAQATDEEVETAWEGLGYYRRARLLRDAARGIVENYGGEFPTQIEKLLEVRGIGPYTAGALASIIGDEKVPLVDGNVIRVMSRVFGILSSDAKDYQVDARAWVQSASGGRDHNEAIMELGATVCRPKNPLCVGCPLRPHCYATATRHIDQLPPRRQRPSQTSTERVVLLVISGSQVLLRRNENGELCRGQWAPLMTGPIAPDQSVTCALSGLLGQLTVAAELVCVEYVGVVRHTVYNERMKLHIFRATSKVRARGQFGALPQRWAELAHLPSPMSTILKKSLRLHHLS